MRLRSPHIVVLFLLAFAGQVREDRALRLVACSIHQAGQFREVAQVALRHDGELTVLDRQAQSATLPPQALAAVRIPWIMRRPALDSAAISSFTGQSRS